MNYEPQNTLEGENVAMLVEGLSLPENASPGVSVRLTCGQEYHLAKNEPYVRRDGLLSRVLTWTTVCPETGESFEVVTARQFKEFPARRAPGVRKPGRKVRTAP